MLAYLIDAPFNDDNWLFEIKWDGYRAIGEVKGDKVNLYSRSFKSFNTIYPEIVEALQKLKIEAIFDGELVIINKKGLSDFQAMQNYQRDKKGHLHYCIFDLLYWKGKDLRDTPLIERKALLEKILKKSKDPRLVYSDHILSKGKELYKLAQKKHIEGIMAKEIHSPYESKRSRNWLKIKTHGRQEVIICGFTQPRGSRKAFGSLIIGVHEKGVLRYAGHVGGGFDEKSLTRIKAILLPLITPKCPFTIVPKTNMPVTWVKPKLLCEVSFAEWTREGIMRQPIFMGLRSDKTAAKVIHEKPIQRRRSKINKSR